MSLQKLDDGWMRFGTGWKWRCKAPGYFCEVQNPNNVPVYTDSKIVARIREVRSFYAARIKDLGFLNSFGYGIDVLVANSFTESGGTVPSPLSTSQLSDIYSGTAADEGARLHAIVQHVAGNKQTKALHRKEPGYSNPLSTPGKISLGAHHHLISTAAYLQGINKPNAAQVRELVQRLPSDSKFAANLAVTYFNKLFSKHQNQPPLLAACYNAGSIRESSQNEWNLKTYGNHIDRWITFFNTSRKIATGLNTPVKTTPANVTHAPKPTPNNSVIPPPAKQPVTPSAKSQVSLEAVMAAMRRKNYTIREADDKEFNLNIVGIRNNNARVNFFDDLMLVFWKYKGVWHSREYNITTRPGLFYLQNQLLNPKGTAILKENQYINSHSVGYHNRSKPARMYEALVQTGKLTVFRDKNLDGKFDLISGTEDTGTGFSVNIHRANGSGTTLNIGKYSAGCQVFGRFEQWTEFHGLFKKAAANWGTKFTYTLLNSGDLG